MYEDTHVCKYVWRLKFNLRCLPQLLPTSFIETESLTWAQSPSDSVDSASQIVPRKLCLHLLSNGISGGLPRPCNIYMGAGNLNFGPQVCTPSAEPSPSLKSALRSLPQSMCERHASLQRDNFQTPQIPGHQFVKVHLFLTTPSCTVSLLSLFKGISTTSQHYKLASFKTEGHPMSYTGSRPPWQRSWLLSGSFINISVLNMIKLIYWFLVWLNNGKDTVLFIR